jgi:hypothetical protein
VSVDGLAAAVRTAAATLPMSALAAADHDLSEAQATLTACAAGSWSAELPEAIEGYGQARQAVGLAYQLCEHVRHMLEHYLGGLGAVSGAGSIPTTVTPQATPISKPASARPWETVAEEHGGPQSFPSYSAAKRHLGSRPGQDLHHIVEQSQAKPDRSDFSVERINTTDNLA